ncbi:MAG: hypothetical protein K1X91_15660 [Bacteriodetes bacterium]|nr:hypothetical protein [Bacteroidota bacterium]
MKSTEFISQIENKWHNVYWFSRMLINNDKYAAIGKRSDLLTLIASSLRVISKEINNDADIIQLQKQTLKNILGDRFKRESSISSRVKLLVSDLDTEIRTASDMEVFILTCENVMIPLNQAIDNIPSDDKVFALHIARSYLDLNGENGLGTVIKLWDDLGIKGCLTAERTEIVKAFTTLKAILSTIKSITETDKDIILTAFTQEFERRAGQKRKSRAGGSLEDVTDFILEYYGIRRSRSPEHFQADIEVDNWVRTKDKWLIGISCKRTIRERWKQVSSAESSVLSRYKIKNIYHIVTYDEDLSDDKLSLLGGQRHVFYLPDDSRRLKHASSHVGLKEYVRPISQLIKDIKQQV